MNCATSLRDSQALATGGIIDAAYLGYAFGAQLERQGFRMLADLLKLGIPFQVLKVEDVKKIRDDTKERSSYWTADELLKIPLKD